MPLKSFGKDKATNYSGLIFPKGFKYYITDKQWFYKYVDHFLVTSEGIDLKE